MRRKDKVFAQVVDEVIQTILEGIADEDVNREDVMQGLRLWDETCKAAGRNLTFAEVLERAIGLARERRPKARYQPHYGFLDGAK